MAITTLAGIASGLIPPSLYRRGGGNALGVDTPANWPCSRVYVSYNNDGATSTTPWPVNMDPGTASPSLNGSALTSKTGAIDFQNPASGNSYLASWLMASSGYKRGVTHRYMLCDRLWENSSGTGGINLDSTSLQSITFPGLPARDKNGATNGDGVHLAIELSGRINNYQSTNLNTQANLPQITYTNQAGTGSKTANPSLVGTNFNAGGRADGGNQSGGSAPEAFIFCDLAAGDTGVRSVDGITFPTLYSTTGSSQTGFRLVLYRPICTLLVDSRYGAPTYLDAIRLGFPRIYDNSVLFLVSIEQEATDGTPRSALPSGMFEFAQG